MTTQPVKSPGSLGCQAPCPHHQRKQSFALQQNEISRLYKVLSFAREIQHCLKACGSRHLMQVIAWYSRIPGSAVPTPPFPLWECLATFSAFEDDGLLGRCCGGVCTSVYSAFFSSVLRPGCRGEAFRAFTGVPRNDSRLSNTRATEPRHSFPVSMCFRLANHPWRCALDAQLSEASPFIHRQNLRQVLSAACTIHR